MYLEVICGSEERWIPIAFDDIQDKYFVSDYGRIKNIQTGKILKQSYDKYGYKIISLQTKEYQRRTYKVHRLVLISFKGIDHERTTVNHINGEKDDNRLCNLEWMDNFEQQRHAINIGLKKFKKGAEAPNNVYDEELVNRLCKLLADGIKPKNIAKILNVPNNKKLHSLIYRIRSGRHWSHIYKKHTEL